MRDPRPMWVALGAILVALSLGGQAAADSLLSGSGGMETGRSVGRASFAYLSGIRTAAAAMLWNRLEPQLHEYYGHLPLEEQKYVVPTISLVVTLDPDFEQAYYVGAWVIARNDKVEEGIALARAGAENLPRSGLLRTSLAQMIAIFEQDYEAAAQQAEIAAELEYANAIEKHDSYAILRSIFNNAGRTAEYERLGVEIERLDEEIGDALPADAHDHDGDGVPDH